MSTPKFDPLPDSFFAALHTYYQEPFICDSCTKPTCSCSGGSRARAVLLPGEGDWIEKKLGKKLNYVDENKNLFQIEGDCVYLENKQCQAKLLKPWECWAYPLCPFWDSVLAQWVPNFARNCSYPTEVPRPWLASVWAGWQYISTKVPWAWMAWYSSIPDYDTTTSNLLQIGSQRD